MGKRVPTATLQAEPNRRRDYSRWGNACQPQQVCGLHPPHIIIADGETRANRNPLVPLNVPFYIIAEGETRANRN